MHRIEQKTRKAFEELNKTTHKEYGNRFSIELMEVKVRNKSSVRVQFLMTDEETSSGEMIYEDVYMLGKNFMFHRVWNNFNRFVIDCLKRSD